jgi:hypothetical protein
VAANETTETEKRTFEVLVYAPRNPSDRRPYSFDKHLTVGEAAKQVAPDFGYVGGQPKFAHDGRPLDRNKQLVAEHIHDGDVLELVDGGGGV